MIGEPKTNPLTAVHNERHGRHEGVGGAPTLAQTPYAAPLRVEDIARAGAHEERLPFEVALRNTHDGDDPDQVIAYLMLRTAPMTTLYVLHEPKAASEISTQNSFRKCR